MPTGAPSRAHAALLLLALAGCEGTISVTFRTGPQEVEISDGSLGLPSELDDGAGRIESFPCGPAGMCPPSTEITLECVSGVCNPAPRGLVASVGDVVDTDALIAETREIGVRRVESYSIDEVAFEVLLNTLTIGVGPVEIYWGPEAATAIDPSMGVRHFGSVPRVEPGTTPRGMVEIDPAGMAALSDYLVTTGTRVRFFGQTEVDLEPGDPFPRGSLRVAVDVTMTAVGRVL